MAQLPHIQPLIEWGTGSVAAFAADANVHVAPKSGRFRPSTVPVAASVLRHLAQGFRLTSLDGDPQASLKVEMDLTGVVLAATVVVFSDNLSQQVIQRVNRLIKGSGFALKSYHRAGGRIRMNGGSKYHDLPGEMTLARSTSHGEGMTVWSWFSDSGAPHATTEAPVVTAYPSCDYCSDPLTEPSIGHKCPEPMPVPVPVPAPAPVTPPMAA